MSTEVYRTYPDELENTRLELTVARRALLHEQRWKHTCLYWSVGVYKALRRALCTYAAVLTICLLARVTPLFELPLTFGFVVAISSLVYTLLEQ